MKLLLIRHGKTYFNELDLTQGWCDSPLSDLGITQAKDLAKKIKDISIDEAYSSTSERAYDTLELALNNPHIIITRDRRLKELNFGYFEGQPNALKRKMVKEDFRDIETSCDFRPFHGENLADVVGRHLDFFHEVVSDEDKTIAIGGHGLSLTAFIHYLCEEQLQKEFPHFRFLGNACAVLMEYKNQQYKVLKIFE
ncbi:MAG: histidine phosphatase family protein [Sharpea porci]|jgi:alpha-ribazole phosphatase|uniref:histidine phosphatase family protein n=1 Tax=Sharpea porci TaxID=2652286 RepID=UPI002409EAAC|nr:histidine phosphatase family protein [Sharpea porci]MDD6712512.1 histidine phosphatase family protein [Sharpea porci]